MTDKTNSDQFHFTRETTNQKKSWREAERHHVVAGRCCTGIRQRSM